MNSVTAPSTASFVPKYAVELIAKNNTHSYRVRWLEQDNLTTETWHESIYPGVTGTLGIINKPALVNWAKKEALKIVQDGLMKLLSPALKKRVTISYDFIQRLVDEARKKPDRLKDAAADLGTKAHAYIDVIVKGGRPEKLDNDILKPVSAFAEWWRKCGITLLLGDTKVASRVHQYGGSLDAVGWDGARQCLVLIDFKTSKAIYDEYALQVSAYVRAFEEMYGVSIPRAICIRFAKDGARTNENGFEVVEVRSIDESFKAFLAAKELAERMKFEHFVR